MPVEVAARVEGDAGGQGRREHLGGSGSDVRAARLHGLVDQEPVAADVDLVGVTVDMCDLDPVDVRCTRFFRSVGPRCVCHGETSGVSAARALQWTAGRDVGHGPGSAFSAAVRYHPGARTP